MGVYQVFVVTVLLYLGVLLQGKLNAHHPSSLFTLCFCTHTKPRCVPVTHHTSLAHAAPPAQHLAHTRGVLIPPLVIRSSSTCLLCVTSTCLLCVTMDCFDALTEQQVELVQELKSQVAGVVQVRRA